MQQDYLADAPDCGHWKRNFFTIAAGQAVSLVGSSAVQFSLIWWIASETSSALMLSLAGLLAFLPQLFVGPFAGVWIDRWKRKAVIIGADAFIALAAGAFALLFLFGSAPPYWAACVVLGIRALGNVFHTPAMQAAMPMLVPPEQLVRANGWSQMIQSGAFMLGPVIGAALYAALPMPVIMLTDVLGAAVACLSVAAVRIPDPKRERREAPHLFREMKEGAAALLKNRELSIVLLAAALCMVFVLPLSTMYPLMTSVHFSGTAWQASVVEFVYAGGMMLCGAIVGARGKIRRKFPVVHAALIGYGVFSLLSGMLPQAAWAFWAFALLCALMGASATLYNVPLMAYLQQAIPPESLGRVFSLIGSVMCLAMPVGLLFAGPIAEVYGIAALFAVSGVAQIAIMLASLWLTSAPRRRASMAQGDQ